MSDTSDGRDREGTQVWTAEKNARRCALVDKEIEGTLAPAEAVELEELQNQMLAYLRKVAPLPLEDLRKLHQELIVSLSVFKAEGREVTGE